MISYFQVLKTIFRQAKGDTVELLVIKLRDWNNVVNWLFSKWSRMSICRIIFLLCDKLLLGLCAEVGKVTFKINGDEALSDESV